MSTATQETVDELCNNYWVARDRYERLKNAKKSVFEVYIWVVCYAFTFATVVSLLFGNFDATTWLLVVSMLFMVIGLANSQRRLNQLTIARSKMHDWALFYTQGSVELACGLAVNIFDSESLADNHIRCYFSICGIELSFDCKTAKFRYDGAVESADLINVLNMAVSVIKSKITLLSSTTTPQI